MEITQEELKKKIENGDKLIIDFFTTWCGPCKVMKPVFEKVSQENRNNNSEVELYTINVEENREISAQYGVRSVPTIKVFSNGDVVQSKTGRMSEQEINELVEDLRG